MSDAKDSKPMSAADAAKLVKRVVVVRDGNAERVTHERITAAEVLAWKDHGTHVVVVTTDGHKFSSAEA